MMLEVEGIDARLRLQPGTFEAAIDGALFSSLQLHVQEPFQRRRQAEVLSGRFRQSRLHLAAYGRESQLIQFLFERSHRVPFRSQE